jgi:tetratricopeptide (TPR) repeat protein
MIPRPGQLLLSLAIAAGGCAVNHARPSTAPVSTAATQPSDPKAFLTLDQIKPVPHLSEPSTQPTTRPSLDALVLYGKARDAQAHGQRYLAISDLEKALALDPKSYELHLDLAKAYLAVSNTDDRAIPAFQQAAAIEPDHLDLQTDLGRQYLVKGDLAEGIKHLRLALQTSEYATDDGQAAVADFFLARALKNAGYDRAALDQYDVLLRRLQNPSLTIRQNPELAYLIDRPELMYVQIGELYEKHGDYAEALKAYQPAAERDPDNLDLQARIARMLASLGRHDAALALSADLIVRSHATPDSLADLADVCRRLNLPGGAVDELRKLHEQRPKDRPILFALVDMLVAQGDQPQAEQCLARAWEKSPADVQIIRRLVPMYRQHGAVMEAARVLVIALAHDPDALGNLAPLWNDLLRANAARTGGTSRLRLAMLQGMHFAPNAQAAKEFWISRLAQVDHRDALATAALRRSVSAVPPFAPAYRALLAETWANDGLSNQQKIDASDHLVAAVNHGGNTSLATELRGLSLLNQKQSDAAGEAFAKVIQQGNKSPDLLLTYAVTGRKPGKDPQFEKRMWKLLSDYPLYEDGYAVLFRYYAGAEVGSINDALKVLSTWLTADPQSITARVIEANVAEQLGQTQEAEVSLLRLFAEDPDAPDVLEGLQHFYTQAGRPGEFIAKLEDYRAKHRSDTEVVAKLVATYAGQKRMAEAIRVLDDTRLAVGNDPDLLYGVAQLYAGVGEKKTAEDVLQQVIRLDPAHAGACNDLGFSWADEGKNLERAETLIRVAVTAEPDNQSFLDSLGWVLYKRGQFNEARQYLEQAIDPATTPDPVVLDHLGDALYRLSLPKDAVKQWQRALKGIGPTEREDLKPLGLQLRKKIQQADAKQTVDVAPVDGSAATEK